MPDTVVNNTEKHRYELEVEGHLAATYYKLTDGVITFVHTEVPPELGGKGVGSKLVKGALDQVRVRVRAGADQHRTDRRIGQHCLYRRGLRAVSCGQRFGGRRIHVHDVTQPRTGMARDIAGVDGADASGAEYRNVDPFNHRSHHGARFPRP